ncbi:MAG: RsmE family RNA methyltransferase [Chloroflexi bacterium]|nr:RsmE family RNA methyltransferase [Chloroflexota bacterium]
MSSLHRFFVPQSLSPGDIGLPPHVARQVSTVLRMRVGDRLVLFDGSGDEWDAILVAAGKGTASVRLDERRTPETESTVRLTLCQALLKADKFEWVLQKATELGVAEFVPLVPERVVAAGHTGHGSRRARRQPG